MRKFFLITLLLLLTVIYFPLSAQPVQSGSWSVNQSIAGYSLDNNNGERVMTVEVEFETPFAKKPQIILSVTQIDADKEFNTRYNVEAISISRDKFTIRVRTWADSKMFSISGYWLATVK
ncbi:MAG TPA: hypothetical protein DHV28_12020 [Ignavibacteriales bacterium]|nr:hypothetical protein [Ignavibacteriales bacterium]